MQKLLRESPSMTRAELAEVLSCSDATVKRTLKTLSEKGVIQRIGSRKNGEWIVLK